MRVLIFLPALTLGGAERQGLLVARHLRNRGHEVDIWAFPPPGNSASLLSELQQHGLRYQQLHAWPDFDWRFADGPVSREYLRGYYYWIQRLRWYASDLPRQTFDIVIPFTFWPSLAATLLHKRLGARKHYWTQRGGYDDAGVNYSRFLVRRILAHRPRFLANSSAGSKFLQDTFRLPGNRVAVIPNAYAAAADDCIVEPRADRPRSAELSLIHVANFYREKDYDTVFRALQILDTQGVHCRLHICGAFPQESQRPAVFERLSELGIAHMVEYHGPTPRAEVMRLLRAADIGLLSSKSEGQPNAVMEYMHSGLPVVATNIPGICEIVGPANAPYLFEIGDAPKLAQLIAQFDQDSALRRDVGLANRERISTVFAPERVLPQWADLIEAPE